jgi:hypothetical protein
MNPLCDPLCNVACMVIFSDRITGWNTHQARIYNQLYQKFRNIYTYRAAAQGDEDDVCCKWKYGSKWLAVEV